ncbi:MAG: DUF362 domain-containing protein [Deltaproteobacteria bacterium]|nr:DUF362 domain-containing protein [Deltaproteobacteria bacterium]
MTQGTNNRIPVALAQCDRYESPELSDTVARLLALVRLRPDRGAAVLVKPNLLAPTPPDYLPCTHPLVVRAVCSYLIDHGCKVQVGDSPTFGNGIEIAGRIGLTEALADLGIPVVNLDQPKRTRLPSGAGIAISRVALESDMIVNVPKLKAHHQTRITGAVKNVYGCVTGLRKPLMHLLRGTRDSCFERMLLEMWQILPTHVSLMDAVTAMHVRGPNKGAPYPLGLLAASRSPVALDTAVMSILGLTPEDAPLWSTSQRLNQPGSRPEDLDYPLESPTTFDAPDFRLPSHLNPLSFMPWKMAVQRLKRLLDRRSERPNGRKTLR